MLSSMICHLLSINGKGGKKRWEVGSLMTMEELQPKKQELGAKRNHKRIPIKIQHQKVKNPIKAVLTLKK
jgi:hypothetical protein